MRNAFKNTAVLHAEKTLYYVHFFAVYCSYLSKGVKLNATSWFTLCLIIQGQLVVKCDLLRDQQLRCYRVSKSLISLVRFKDLVSD